MDRGQITKGPSGSAQEVNFNLDSWKSLGLCFRKIAAVWKMDERTEKQRQGARSACC